MRGLFLDNFKKQVASKNVFVRVFEIPGEERGFLSPVGKCQHLLSGLREFLVKRCGNDRVWAVRTVDYFTDWIRGLIATNGAAGNLIFSFFRR